MIIHLNRNIPEGEYSLIEIRYITKGITSRDIVKAATMPWKNNFTKKKIVDSYIIENADKQRFIIPANTLEREMMNRRNKITMKNAILQRTPASMSGVELVRTMR